MDTTQWKLKFFQKKEKKSNIWFKLLEQGHTYQCGNTLTHLCLSIFPHPRPSKNFRCPSLSLSLSLIIIPALSPHAVFVSSDQMGRLDHRNQLLFSARQARQRLPFHFLRPRSSFSPISCLMKLLNVFSLLLNSPALSVSVSWVSFLCFFFLLFVKIHLLVLTFCLKFTFIWLNSLGLLKRHTILPCSE